METEIKNVSELGREIFFRIPPEEVEACRKKIIEEFRQHAQIEGFRKGKVPASLVAARYAEAIREQILQRLIPEAYLKTIKEKHLSVVSEPEVSEVKLDQDGLHFKVYVELKPEVNLSRYLGLTLKKVEPEQITEEMVNQVLSQWENKPELAASIIDPEKRRAWKERIREQLEILARTKARAAEEKQIWDQLFSQAKFALPEKLVQERASRYTEEELKRQNLQGKNEEEINRLAKEIFEKVKPRGVDDVRKYFILEKVAENEGLVCTEEELTERIRHIARAAGESEEQIREKMRKAGRLEELKSEIRLDKAFALILEKAQVISRVVLPEETPGKVMRSKE
ncbi:MAG: hypothetical protein NC911_06915 [Candidatus Omnitrophica bacterium]|nr:hypothetical protein [Candidatus Omnitrophota bacterium]